MNKNQGIKILWGIFFILAAVYIIISRYIDFPRINIFRLFITVFFILMFLDGLRQANFFEILFSIACLCILYDRLLGITAITPFPVLYAALFGSIGLTMIFGKKKRPYIWNNPKSKIISGVTNEQCSGENIWCKNNFGSAIRYINSNNFHGAELSNSFGSMAVYFDNAVIQENSAYVNVENNFGETKLYIPKEWKIENNLQHTFGAINEIGKPAAAGNVTLYINGETSFGAISIYYV